MNETNVAVIGCGFMGALYARICSEMTGVRVVAVHDALPDRAEKLAQAVGASAYAGDAYDSIWQAHPEIQAVLICTPENRHLEPICSAAAVGKHMMVEKPLAESVEAAQAAAAAVAGRDLVTMIAYSLRFDPRYVALREAISQGEIGDVLQITACRNPPASALTRIQGRVELPFWVGIHDIDMMRWITGSEVDRVTAIATAQTVGGWPVRRAYLALLALANGVIASLENVWEETSAFDRPQSSAHFKVQGTQGMIEVAASAHGVTIRGRNNTTMPDTVYMPEIGGHVTGVYRNQIAAFIRCVREGRPSDIPLEDGLAGVRVAEAISLSARVGHEVVLNQSVNPTPISVNRNTSSLSERAASGRHQPVVK